MLSIHLRLGLPSGLYPSGFDSKRRNISKFFVSFQNEWSEGL
jgi:hypothetical protein